MPITVVVDLQLGDCGKGKIVDYLAKDADVVFRWNGGGNAGHHVINELGEFKLHHIPVGILRGKTSVLGNGMVINPVSLCAEIDELSVKGFKVKNRLFVSDRAHLVMPWHLLEDEAVEASSGRAGIGSTKRGIAYAYADKMRRKGFRLADYASGFGAKSLSDIRDRMAAELKRIRFLYGKKFNYEKGIEETSLIYWGAICRLMEFSRYTENFLRASLKNGARLLGEGAQGFHLDIDFGRYPFVSSSSACAGGIYQGAGIPPTEVPRVIGVAKAYTTYVGTGPLPTEFDKKMGEYICDRGKEYGTTTGRRRRVGWFDVPMAQMATEQNGCREMILMKLDVLSGISPLKIAHIYELRGKGFIRVPSDAESHQACAPVYMELDGWEYPLEQINDLAHIERTAPQAIEYAKTIGHLVGVKVIALSTGAHHDQTFFF